MANNIQYIGARYVPKFANPTSWNKERSYEALEVVTYGGNSYTSKIPVPIGIELTNDKYWVLTGNYNEQLNAALTEIKNANPKWASVKTFMADPDSETEDIGTAILLARNSGVKTLYIPGGNYTLNTDIASVDISIIADREAVFTSDNDNAPMWSGKIRLINNVLDGNNGLIINNTNSWNGPSGYVCSGLFVTDVAKGNGHFEWGIVGQLENYSDVGENVAIYAQANKRGNGATWGLCVEANDQQPNTGDGGQLIGEEITYKCSKNVSGEGIKRIVCHSALYNNEPNLACYIDHGYLMTGASNITVNKGLSFEGITLNTGIDLTSANYPSNGIGIKMGYTPIDFNGARLALGSDGMLRITSGEVALGVASTGVQIANLFFNGAVATGTNKDALDAKLEGVDTWVQVNVDGVAKWLPLFAVT